MAEGVVIPIEGDASGLDRAIDRASAALRSLGSVAAGAAGGGLRTLEARTEGVGRATNKAATAVDKYKDAAYADNKAANATGGALTFLTGPLEDVGDLLEKGGLRMAAMSVGGLAVVGAMYAVGAAVAAAGRAIYETTQNASELIKELELAGRDVLPLHRMAMLDAESAVENLEASHTALTLVIVSQFAPAMRDAADVTSGLNDAFARGITDVASWSKEIDMLLDSMSLRWRVVSYLSGAVSDLMYELGAPGREARRQADAAREVADANTAWMKALGAQLDKEEQAADVRPEHTRQIRERTQAIREVVALVEDMPAMDVDIAAWFGEDANANLAAATAGNRELAEAIHGVALSSAEANAAAYGGNEARATAEAQTLAYYDRLDQRAQAWAANTIGLSRMVFDTAVMISDAATENERKAARKRAIIIKAAAITEATINTLLATTKALASSSPPINFVLAGLTAAFGAVQIGLIAAKPLVYHRGGMLDPDEERLSQSSAVVRRNESMAIVTGGGAAAAQRAVSRTNAGEVSSGDTYLIVDGDVMRTRRVGGPDPGYGRRGRR